MLKRNRYSLPLTAAAIFVFALGIITGAVDYANSGHTNAEHAADTSAWGVHIGLTIFAAVWIVVALQYPALRPPMPLSAAFGRRVRRVYRHRLRAIVVTVLLLLCSSLLWRMGVQIIGGLDPEFTANAWGGPGYAGALYCHYLDCAIMIAVALVFTDRLILPSTAIRPRQSP